MLKFEKKIPLLLLFLLIPFSTLLFSCDTLMDDLDSVAEAVLAEEAKNNYVTYTVNHLLQNIEDDEYTIDYSITEQGLAGENTHAVANEYKGFTVLPFEQESIASDGTTIIEIYYDRNIHTITYTDGLDQTELRIPESTGHKFGESVYINFTDIGSLEHFEFTGWKDLSSGITYSASSNPYIEIPDTDITLEAQWETTLSSYYIVHKTQDLNASTYTEYQTQTFYGDKNTETVAEALNIEGFTAQTISQQIISEDSSTVVEVFYDRNYYTITYNDNDDTNTITVPDEVTIAYEDTCNVNFTDIGSRLGYTFNGWNTKADGSGELYQSDDETSFTVEANNVTLYAQWLATTANGITISVPTYSDNSGTLTLTSEVTGTIDAGNTSTATFTVTTTSGYNNFYWFVDGESVQTGSSTTFTITTNDYSAGNHTLLLYAEDSSGNSATAETTFTIVK